MTVSHLCQGLLNMYQVGTVQLLNRRENNIGLGWVVPLPGRIITFLVGNPYKPSFPLLLGRGTTQGLGYFWLLLEDFCANKTSRVFPSAFITTHRCEEEVWTQDVLSTSRGKLLDDVLSFMSDKFQGSHFDKFFNLFSIDMSWNGSILVHPPNKHFAGEGVKW